MCGDSCECSHCAGQSEDESQAAWVLQWGLRGVGAGTADFWAASAVAETLRTSQHGGALSTWADAWLGHASANSTVLGARFTAAWSLMAPGSALPANRYHAPPGEDGFEIDEPPDPFEVDPPLNPRASIDKFEGWSIQEPEVFWDRDAEGNPRLYRVPIVGIPPPRLPPLPPGTISAPRCCVRRFEYPIPRVLKPTNVFNFPGFRTVWWRFRGIAEFTNDPQYVGLPWHCSCACCEFRQYIRVVRRYGNAVGTTEGFVEDCVYKDEEWDTIAAGVELATKWVDATTGEPLPHTAELLPEEGTVEAVYDKIAQPPPSAPPSDASRDCYGRKDVPLPPKKWQGLVDPNEGYLRSAADEKKKIRWAPPAVGACYYWMSDTPHVSIPKNGSIQMDFLGVIVDVCRGEREIARRTFRLSYPETQATPERVRLESFAPIAR